MKTWTTYWRAVLPWTVAFATLLVLFRISVLLTGPTNRLWHDAALTASMLPTYAALALSFSALAGGVAASRARDTSIARAHNLWPLVPAALATVILSYGLDAFAHPMARFVIEVHVLGKDSALLFPRGPETPDRLLALIATGTSDPSTVRVPLEVLRFNLAQGISAALCAIPHSLIGALIGFSMGRNLSWHALALSTWGFAIVLLACHVHSAKIGRAVLNSGAPPIFGAALPLAIPLVVLIVLGWSWRISRLSHEPPFGLDD